MFFFQTKMCSFSILDITDNNRKVSIIKFPLFLLLIFTLSNDALQITITPQLQRVPRQPRPHHLVPEQTHSSHSHPFVSTTTTPSFPPLSNMAKITIAKKSTAASLLRRIGAKPLKKIPADRDILKRSIRKFVIRIWDLEEEKERQEKMKKKMEKEARLQAYFNRMSNKIDKRLQKEINSIRKEHQFFEQLGTLHI